MATNEQIEALRQELEKLSDVERAAVMRQEVEFPIKKPEQCSAKLFKQLLNLTLAKFQTPYPSSITLGRVISFTNDEPPVQLESRQLLLISNVSKHSTIKHIC